MFIYYWYKDKKHNDNIVQVRLVNHCNVATGFHRWTLK